MAGKFVIAKDTKPEVLDWGRLGWMSNPPTTGAKQLTVIDVNLAPGKGPRLPQAPGPGGGHLHRRGRGGAMGRPGERKLGPGDSPSSRAAWCMPPSTSGRPTRRSSRSSARASGRSDMSWSMFPGEAPWKDLRKR